MKAGSAVPADVIDQDGRPGRWGECDVVDRGWHRPRAPVGRRAPVAGPGSAGPRDTGCEFPDRQGHSGDGEHRGGDRDCGTGAGDARAEQLRQWDSWLGYGWDVDARVCWRDPDSLSPTIRSMPGSNSSSATPSEVSSYKEVVPAATAPVARFVPYGQRRLANSLPTRALAGVSSRAMRGAAIALLVIGGLAGAVFWVALVAWPVSRETAHLVDFVSGRGTLVVCAITGNTLWQAAKLRDGP